MTPQEARELMHEWTESAALRGHMEAVAACMRSYAALLDEGNADCWEVCGLLHDFDYERHPTEQEHPFVGVGHLETIGVEEDIRTAILGHAAYSGVARESAMAKALFAVDELAGFIVACAKVRPNGIADMAPKSVKKKLKDKAFAAAVSREDIAEGHADLEALSGLDMAAHVERCIEAIRGAGDRVPI